VGQLLRVSTQVPEEPPAQSRGVPHSRLRRVLFIWLSVELAAGIVALSEIVFALPPLILLESGRSAVAQLLPMTLASGTGAVYLGWHAFPLVHQVAELGRTSA
jgi:hypothetical protein